MINPKNSSEIKKLVAEGNLKEAIIEIETLLFRENKSREEYNEAILLSYDLCLIDKAQRLGFLEQERADKERKIIAWRTLLFLDYYSSIS